MPKIEPVRCVCGCSPDYQYSHIGSGSWVAISKHRVYCVCGWRAPWKHSQDAATNIWNRVMTAAKWADNE